MYSLQIFAIPCKHLGAVQYHVICPWMVVQRASNNSVCLAMVVLKNWMKTLQTGVFTTMHWSFRSLYTPSIMRGVMLQCRWATPSQPTFSEEGSKTRRAFPLPPRGELACRNVSPPRVLQCENGLGMFGLWDTQEVLISVWECLFSCGLVAMELIFISGSKRFESCPDIFTRLLHVLVKVRYIVARWHSYQTAEQF